jgi:exodeoxyribonuclease V alpha subunit
MLHYLLLSRNLLSTGLTRASQLAILMGPPKAIGFAVKRMLDRQRSTVLLIGSSKWARFSFLKYVDSRE